MARKLLFEIKKSEKYLSNHNISMLELHCYLTKENSSH